MGRVFGARQHKHNIQESVCPSVMNKSAVWPGVHAPVNNQSPKSLCINMGAPLRPLCGGGGELVFIGVCVQMENVSLHCRCNNLNAGGRGQAGGGVGGWMGSSITISSPPSASLWAK